MYVGFLSLYFMLSAFEQSTDSTINNVARIDPWSETDDSILYEVELVNKFELKIPENCTDIGICENVPDLPDKEISQLINIMIADKVKFNFDKGRMKNYGNYKNTVELCKSKSMTFRPQAAKDVNGDWYLVVNSEMNKVQSFNGEACLGSPGELCDSVATFQRNYKGECIQKYTNRRMVVFSKDFKRIIVKMLLVPSCCSCIAVSINYL